MITNGSPFSAAYYADVLDGEDGEKEVLISSVIPIFVHFGSQVAPEPSRLELGEAGTKVAMWELL